MIKQNLDIQGFGIVKDQIKEYDDLNNNPNLDAIDTLEINKIKSSENQKISFSQKKYIKNISMKKRIKNLFKFYMKNVPNRIV